MNESILTLKNLKKTFGDVPAVEGIDLDILKGEFITILGPSGCGKTTTLRMIAGLERPDEGSILLEGVDVTDTAPERRNVNTVFQNYALFPHMNVARNVGYGLKLRGHDKESIRRRVTEMLSLVQLEGYEKRMPDQLSGGQQQRVAIARALATGPALLLLDEPLGALDLQLRRQMQEELKRLQSHLGITFIYITHDQEEALNMSDRIVVMDGGRFQQVGTPEDIYEHPQTLFVAQFIGQANIVLGTVEKVEGDRASVRFADGIIEARGQDLRKGMRITLSVRAERIGYQAETYPGFDLDGIIKSHNYVGGVLRTVIVLPNDQELFITGANPKSQYPVGCPVKVFWDSASAAIVEREAGHA